MSTVATEEEKYVNGCRLSSSLLELQPFKVVTSEAKPMPAAASEPRNHSNNNNNRYNKGRTNSNSEGVQRKKDEHSGYQEISEMPLLPKTDAPTANNTSVSCGNLFENPSLRVKDIPASEAQKNSNYGGRAASADFDSTGQGHSLPKPSIQRSTSKDKLLSTETTRSQQSENKRTPPAKPNRESLRRSKQDVRASHPNLQSANRSSLPREGLMRNNSDRQASTPMAVHQYEELPVDVRSIQQRHISQGHVDNSQFQSAHDPGFTPIAFQSTSSPAVPERPRNPRQRQNPLYAGLHMNPYDANAASGEGNKKRPPTRCLRCLITGMAIAVILSVISVIALALMVLGYVEPVQVAAVLGSKNSSIYAQLQSANHRLAEQDAMIQRMESEILFMMNRTNQSIGDTEQRVEQAKWDLLEAVKSLNISALKGPSTADVGRCVHKTYYVGSSSSQEETDSGEYFAEEGHVIVGAACSSSPGFVSYLHAEKRNVRRDRNKGTESPSRVVYGCKCRKMRGPGHVAPGSRIECRIHYWQCPVIS